MARELPLRPQREHDEQHGQDQHGGPGIGVARRDERHEQAQQDDDGDRAERRVVRAPPADAVAVGAGLRAGHQLDGALLQHQPQQQDAGDAEGRRPGQVHVGPRQQQVAHLGRGVGRDERQQREGDGDAEAHAQELGRPQRLLAPLLPGGHPDAGREALHAPEHDDADRGQDDAERRERRPGRGVVGAAHDGPQQRRGPGHAGHHADDAGDPPEQREAAVGLAGGRHQEPHEEQRHEDRGHYDQDVGGRAEVARRPRPRRHVQVALNGPQRGDQHHEQYEAQRAGHGGAALVGRGLRRGWGHDVGRAPPMLLIRAD